jgi:beta-1,4-mannosyl-glycoprotein beta-1,4-N-acetylglucosaminyltransferase
MIYDCFTFFNELELLNLRLNELDCIVDKFVLVEATKTFSGLSKPLYFSENRERFRTFSDKIIHIIVDDMPGGDGPRDHWKRDNFQRNAIGRGLKNGKPEDIVMVSDIDEIPNTDTLKRFCETMSFQNTLFSNIIHTVFNSRLTCFIFHRKCLRHFLRKKHPFIWRFEQSPCGLFLNRKIKNTAWYGTIIAYYRDFSVAEEMRHSGYKIIKNGGWHFTFMGGANRIKSKIAATAHQEINTPDMLTQIIEQTTIDKISYEIERGTIELVPDTELPHYVTMHRNQFCDLLIDSTQLRNASNSVIAL